MIIAVLLALTLCPAPLSLDGISVERARSLHGRLVVTTFLTAKPGYTWRDGRSGVTTVVGAADRDDEAERGVVLRGNRLDIGIGKRVTVVGVLRVIDHGPYAVGGVIVPPWVEMRVEAR